MRRTPARRKHQSRGNVIFGAVIVVAGLAVLALAGLLMRTPAPLVVTSNNVKGAAEAPVEIEDWSDFQCPACKAFTTGPGRQLDERLIPDGQVRVVFRHMAFLGDESVWAAAASECAADQGQFWAYHDTLFVASRGRGSGVFNKANLKQFGADLGLDRAAFNACVDSDQMVARVQDDVEAGKQKGVMKTPTLFVNGRKIEGAPTWPDLQRLVGDVAMAAPASR